MGEGKRGEKGRANIAFLFLSVWLAWTEPLMWYTGWIKERKSIPIFLQSDHLSDRLNACSPTFLYHYFSLLITIFLFSHLPV